MVRGFTKLAVFLGQFCGAGFDVFGHFRQGGPASLVENFRPWYCAGLWLAVKLIAPSSLLRIIS